MELMTWQTYKKKYNPKMYALHDSIGSVLKVSPTMKESGFTCISLTEIDEERSMKELVIDELNNLGLNINLAVYYKWRCRSGLYFNIDIYFKKGA
jgi:hypothetical protein